MQYIWYHNTQIMDKGVFNENDGAMSASMRRNSKTPKLEDEEIYIVVDPDVSDDIEVGGGRSSF